MEYNKLNIFYLALTEKKYFIFRFPYELCFERISLKGSITSQCSGKWAHSQE